MTLKAVQQQLMQEQPLGFQQPATANSPQLRQRSQELVERSQHQLEDEQQKAEAEAQDAEAELVEVRFTESC